MPISPSDWVRPGISLGLRNAAQKNTITASPESIARNSGLVTPHEPMWNIGCEREVLQPGRGVAAPAENVAASRGGRDVSGHRSSPFGGFPCSNGLPYR